MSALLIVNPFASGVDERRLAAVEEALPAGTEVVLTRHAGEAKEIAAAAGGRDAVYTFGGDGTYNEVLNGADAETPLGFVPGGGTSVLPRALGLPRDPVEAARRLAAGTTRRISLGRVNGRRFGFGAGVGFVAEFVREVDNLGRRHDGKRPGDASFAWTTVRTLARRRFTYEPVLELEGMGRAAFVLVANCDPYTYVGGVALRAAPRASFDGGLDVVAPVRLGPLAIPRFAAYLALGRGHEGADDILQAHDLSRLVVGCDVPQPLQVDGEDLGDVTEAVFESEPDAVTVLV